MARVVTGVVRRGGRAARSLGPATVAVALALIIGAAGFADAATGGTFLLEATVARPWCRSGPRSRCRCWS